MRITIIYISTFSCLSWSNTTCIYLKYILLSNLEYNGVMNNELLIRGLIGGATAVRTGLSGRRHTDSYTPPIVRQPHSNVFVDKHFPRASYERLDDDTARPRPVVVVMQSARLALYNSTLSLAHRRSCFHCTAISGSVYPVFMCSCVRSSFDVSHCNLLKAPTLLPCFVNRL